VTEEFALPETLSPSGTGTYQNCPLQFRFQNIQKLPQPPGAAAVKGNVVHRALELLFQLDAPLRTHAAAHDFLATAKSEFEPTYDITGLNLTAAQASKFWADCTTLIDSYLRMEDPTTVDAIETEMWVTAPLAKVALRGIIDRIERDSNGGIIISDYKTGKAPRDIDVEGKMMQLQMYAYMLREMRGELPTSLQLLYIKDGIRHKRTPTEQSMRFVHTRTNALFNAIEKSCATALFPTRKSGLCNYCNFKSWCPEFGGDPSKAAVEAPIKFPRPPQ
jgi:putative RecB family exonuclease